MQMILLPIARKNYPPMLSPNGPEAFEGMAPKSGALIEVFNKLDTGWPDEMSPQRLEEYKAQVKTFREKLKV